MISIIVIIVIVIVVVLGNKTAPETSEPRGKAAPRNRCRFLSSLIPSLSPSFCPLFLPSDVSPVPLAASTKMLCCCVAASLGVSPVVFFSSPLES